MEVEFVPCAFGDMLDMFARHGAAETIWPYMEACGRYGVLYSDTDNYIMARPVDSSLPIDDLDTLADLQHGYQSSGLTDAWYILYGSGNMSLFLEKMPFPLPKVMWKRDGKGPVKTYSLSNLTRHLNHD